MEDESELIFEHAIGGEKFQAISFELETATGIGQILLETSVYDQDLATKEWANEFHELVLLEGSREAIISMFSGDRYGNETPEIFKQISAPTLVIHGEEDNLIEVESSKHFEENIPEVTVKIYSNIGHLPMYEDPERTAEDIRDFIDAIR